MTHGIQQTHTSHMNDHYTVVSRANEVDILRIVIAGSSADAAETHRDHYPGEAIIRVGLATPSVKLTA